LEGHGAKINLLIRAKDQHAADLKLWRAMQLHLSFSRFQHWLDRNIQVFLGDITQPRLGLSPTDYERLVRSTVT
jgi:thioester reductase-like protein